MNQGELFQVNEQAREAANSNRLVSHLSKIRESRLEITFDRSLIALVFLLVALIGVYCLGVEVGEKKVPGVPIQATATAKDPIEIAYKRVSANQTKGSSIGGSATQLTSQPEPNVISEKNQTADVAKSFGVLDAKYTIQLITYLSLARAEKEVQLLHSKGHEAFIISSGKYHQVCIDAFHRASEASQRWSELSRQGYSSTYKGAYVRPVTR